MPLTVIVAAVAALAILLIAVGIASGSGGTGVTARLERYASGRQETAKAEAGSPSLGDLLSREFLQGADSRFPRIASMP